MKKKFLGKITHEFKTPLNTIIGQIGKMKDKFFTIINGEEDIDLNEYKDSLREDLDFVKYLSNYTGYLINDLMHISEY